MCDIVCYAIITVIVVVNGADNNICMRIKIEQSIVFLNTWKWSTPITVCCVSE